VPQRKKNRRKERRFGKGENFGGERPRKPWRNGEMGRSKEKTTNSQKGRLKEKGETRKE